MGGGSVEGGLLAHLLRKRISLLGTTLRSRTDEYKAELTARFARDALPGLADGSLRVVVDREYALDALQEAHTFMESNGNLGKIVIAVSPPPATSA